MRLSATGLQTWSCILCVSALAILGESFIAAAMRRIGDLDVIRAQSGFAGAVRAVLTSPIFLIGALCMALNFFAMLFTVSVVDRSFAAPAAAALTYIGNAFAAKFFLREKVDRRRWTAAAFVAVGVFLLSR